MPTPSTQYQQTKLRNICKGCARFIPGFAKGCARFIPGFAKGCARFIPGFQYRTNTQLQLLETVYNEGKKKSVILTDTEKAFHTIQDPFVIIK